MQQYFIRMGKNSFRPVYVLEEFDLLPKRVPERFSEVIDLMRNFHVYYSTAQFDVLKSLVPISETDWHDFFNRLQTDCHELYVAEKNRSKWCVANDIEYNPRLCPFNILPVQGRYLLDKFREMLPEYKLPENRYQVRHANGAIYDSRTRELIKEAPSEQPAPKPIATPSNPVVEHWHPLTDEEAAAKQNPFAGLFQEPNTNSPEIPEEDIDEICRNMGL